MLRTFALFALLASPAAYACGGKSCGSSCAMSAHADTETAADDVDAADGEKVALTVTGMHCGACATKVTAALKAIDGVNAATVDHASGLAKVAYDTDKTDLDALIAAVTALEFEATKADQS